MPSEETQKVIDHVTRVTHTVDEFGDLKEPAVHIFNTVEKEEREKELKKIDEQLSQPSWVNARLSSERRGELSERARDLRKQLVRYAPRDDLSGETKDALYKLQQELEGKIKPGLLPTEVMWRNPPGAADEHLKREMAIKPFILMWKNVVRMLNPGNIEKDLSNVERLRPSIGHSSGAASFMANARLPGNFAMTPQAKENFDKTFPDSPTVDTPMKQIERREAEEIKALQDKIAALEASIEFNRKKKERAKERMAKARMAKGKKKAEENQPSAK